jgi:protein involved in polysaccharide export with SLBB domain
VLSKEILNQYYLNELLIESKKKSITVSVIGQVKKPGTQVLVAQADRIYLLQAISVAGGFSDIANINRYQRPVIFGCC